VYFSSAQKSGKRSKYKTEEDGKDQWNKDGFQGTEDHYYHRDSDNRE
jgi:hypothetical protein